MRSGEVEEAKKLWDELLYCEEELTNKDLFRIIKKVEPLREQAGLKMLQREPANKFLRDIIHEVETLRYEAGEKLLQQEPTDYELALIIDKVKPLREQAWQELLQRGIGKDDLGHFIDHFSGRIGPLVERAQNVLDKMKEGNRGKEEIMTDIRSL